MSPELGYCLYCDKALFWVDGLALWRDEDGFTVCWKVTQRGSNPIYHEPIARDDFEAESPPQAESRTGGE